jgi:hypothetical protein
MTKIPQDFSNLEWRDVDGCMDKFVCDTGAMVSRVAPQMIDPAAWLLEKIWPDGLQAKVHTFRRAGKISPMKRDTFCHHKYKCRVKKLENLFHSLVVEQTGKLKQKLQSRLRPDEISPANVLRVLLTSQQ